MTDKKFAILVEIARRMLKLKKYSFQGDVET